MVTPLPAIDTLFRKYHCRAHCKPNNDYPSTSAFSADKENEVSLDHRKIWDEPKIREHLSRSRKRNKPEEFKNPDEFGLTALSERTIRGYGRYILEADPTETNEFEPANPAHYTIKVPHAFTSDIVNDLYSIALGYSPPPILEGNATLTCNRWEKISGGSKE